MKALLLIFMTLTFNAQAAAVKSSTQLPAIVRDEIYKEIALSYPHVYELKEGRTKRYERHIDQWIYDDIYETNFSGKVLNKHQQSVDAHFTIRTVDASASSSNPAFNSVYVESIQVQFQQHPMCLGTAMPCSSPTDICCSDGQFCGNSYLCR